MSDPVVSKPTPNDIGLPNPDNQSSAQNLLQNTQFDDPRLYDLLTLLIDDIYKAANAINPRPSKVFGQTGNLGNTSNITGFAATLFSNNLRLTWDALSGAEGYEIRYKSGNVTYSAWDSATVIVDTTTTQVDVNPLIIPLIYGNHTFLIKATNVLGIMSVTATTIVISIPVISGPVISATVIDNFVLLKWTQPSSTWSIDYYNVYKGGVSIGKHSGTFDAIFETTAGNYTYTVEAVDIVGNVSVQQNLLVSVKQPPDYSTQDNRISNLGGTKVNAQVISLVLLAPIDLTTTWSVHFSSHGWTNIQDQINAGYPIYIQPTLSPGSYEEVIDFGVLFNNTITTVQWIENLLAGAVSTVSKLATSTDNITYTAWTTGTSIFASSMRYLKLHLDFTATNDHGLTQISNLGIRLDVKREVDSGSISALAADASGTQVTFNKTFQSIDSVTLATNSLIPLYVTYTGVTLTGFKVLVFDSLGARVDCTVSWKVRGIT